MFDKDKILVCGNELVGYREDLSPIYAALDASLKVSNSGYYINDLAGVDFEVIGAALSVDAISSDDYLKSVYESELINIVSEFVENNKANNSSKELLSNHNLVKGVANFNDKVTQNARFVGYLIKPSEGNNIASAITQLGFQATETQATKLKIYLYETSQNEAVATFDFDITKSLSLTWEAVSDFIVNYQSLTGGTGQTYYLGYYEKDPDNPQDFQLQSQALKMQFDCGCSNSPRMQWGKYLFIKPIEINNEDLNWNGSEYTIPTPDDIFNNVTTQTYGLLAKVNIKCDITDLICTNISMFAKSLQHAIAARLLLDAYTTKRINSIADSKRTDSKDFAFHYKQILNGHMAEDSRWIKGLIQLLTMDFSGLDKVCAPCKKTDITFSNLVR